MATYYVNKSGSSGNNGTTPALAKLTIAQGMALCTTGDTVIVGSGTYAERISYGVAINLYADGVVYLDGTGIITTGIVVTMTIGTSNCTMAAHPTNGGKWIIKNWNVNSVTFGTFYANCNNGIVQHNINNVELYGNVNNSVGVYISNGTVNVANCVFSGFGLYGIYYTGNQGNSFTSNTFYNCGIAINSTVSTYTQYNIFHTNTTSVKFTSNPTTTLNYNIYYSTTNLLTVNTTNYTILSAVQAINSELQGYSANPSLIDPANGVFFLGSVGTYGAYPYSSITKGASANSDGKWIITGATDNTGWYNADGNITKNGTDGAFELSAGVSGVLLSPVYDLGATYSNTKISLASQQTWPTNMIDQTKTDIRPNYQTVSLRASSVSFNQGDATPSWNEVNIESPLSGINGRYLQAKITMRNDDVAG
jgi:hypothetical protein